VALLTWPASSATRVPAGFADGNGLIVFEQTHTLMLGTAAPDGSHPEILSKLSPLQGTDIPAVSSDGRYLVNTEGSLVTMGPAGPVSVTTLAESAAEQASGQAWLDASFADGGKYVAATECFQGANFADSFVANLIPVDGGGQSVLDTVTDATGDPGSAGAFESVPVNASAEITFNGCGPTSTAPDKAIELVRLGQRPRIIITAADLDRAVGLAASTPLGMYVTPIPGGTLLAVSMAVATQSVATQQSGSGLPGGLGGVVITRTGKVVADLRFPLYTMVRWSPEGKRMASCQVGRLAQSTVTITTIGKGSRTIALAGRHDVQCTQLLWSPDGRQLIYAAQTTTKGLTQADDMQHGWTVIDLATGQVHNVTAPGQPIAWLTTTKGQAG
jgi:hypothetical protein